MMKYKRLAPVFLVPFFTWFGLFSLLIYATAALIKYFFVKINPPSLDFENGTKWVGICFALYNILGATITFTLHKTLKKDSKYTVLFAALFFGALGLISMGFIPSKYLLISFIFMAIAWSSISTTLFLFVGEMAPDAESDKYYSIFNFSTVIPQAISAFSLSFVTKIYCKGNMIETLFSGRILC